MARLIGYAKEKGTYKSTKSYINKEELRKKHKKERQNRKARKNER